MRVIGMMGKMAAGKDEYFKALEESGYKVMRRSFADAVRYEIEETIADGMYLPNLWVKPLNDEARALLQWWGTDYRRNQNPNHWLEAVDRALDEIEENDTVMETSTLVVITDCRFPNELDVVRKRGGLVVEVFASQEVRAKRLKLPKEELAAREGHVSETALAGTQPDVRVMSDGRYDYVGDGYARMEAFLREVDKEGGPWANSVLPATQVRR